MEEKIKKSLLMLVALLSFILMSCGCDEENPEVRITNGGTEPASVQVKTSGGNTININNIQPGSTSAWQSFAPGDCIFTATIAGNEFEKTIKLGYCKRYEVRVNSNNTITFDESDM